MPTSCVCIKKKEFPRWKGTCKVSFTRTLLPGRRNDLADEEIEKRNMAPVAQYAEISFRWTHLLLRSLFNIFSPTEAEPVPRHGVETGVGLERRRERCSHISDRLSVFSSGVQGLY